MRDYKVTGVQTCALPIFGEVRVESRRLEGHRVLAEHGADDLEHGRRVGRLERHDRHASLHAAYEVLRSRLRELRVDELDDLLDRPARGRRARVPRNKALGFALEQL